MSIMRKQLNKHGGNLVLAGWILWTLWGLGSCTANVVDEQIHPAKRATRIEKEQLEKDRQSTELARKCANENADACRKINGIWSINLKPSLNTLTNQIL
jgi:uncharacterized protein HemX